MFRASRMQSNLSAVPLLRSCWRSPSKAPQDEVNELALGIYFGWRFTFRATHFNPKCRAKIFGFFPSFSNLNHRQLLLSAGTMKGERKTRWEIHNHGYVSNVWSTVLETISVAARDQNQHMSKTKIKYATSCHPNGSCSPWNWLHFLVAFFCTNFEVRSCWFQNPWKAKAWQRQKFAAQQPSSVWFY